MGKTVEMRDCKKWKKGVTRQREAKNGTSSDTMSDQEVTPQNVIYLFIQVVHYYIQEGVTVQFIS